MAALARAVVELLVRGGWFGGLLLLETVLLLGFWWSGPTPFGDSFDRRAAEADLLLFTLTSLPALFAGALLSSGDHEDGMTDFYRSCRVSVWSQIAGSGLGLFAVTGMSLVLSLLLSLAIGAPETLSTGSPWISLGIGTLSTLVHGLWGLALGTWVRSRWAAVAAALTFWMGTVFALEALITAWLGVLPARWVFAVLTGFLALDPAEFFRVAAVMLRGQSWTYGPVFAPVRDWFGTAPGAAAAVLLVLLHLLLPAVLAWMGSTRRRR